MLVFLLPSDKWQEHIARWQQSLFCEKRSESRCTILTPSRLKLRMYVESAYENPRPLTIVPVMTSDDTPKSPLACTLRLRTYLNI